MMRTRLLDPTSLLTGSVSVGRLRELLAPFEDFDQVTFERYYVKDGNENVEFVDVYEFSEVVEQAQGARVVVKLDFAGTIK